MLPLSSDVSHMIVIAHVKCPHCSKSVPVDFTELIPRVTFPLYSRCEFCKLPVKLPAITSMFSFFAGLAAGGYIGRTALLKAEAVLGTPVSALVFLVIFVVTLAASVAAMSVIMRFLYRFHE